MSLPSVQEKLRQTGQNELSALLGCEVGIDRVYIIPFSRVELSGITVSDMYGDTALVVDKLGAGVSMRRLFLNRRLVINYVELIGPKAKIYRHTPDSPLNITPILEALRSKDDNKQPSRFDIQVNMIVIRRGAASYHVDSLPAIGPGRFDKNHIGISDLKADIGLPRLKNDNFIINLKRLSLKENSGLALTNFQAQTQLNDSGLRINGLNISMPNSSLSFSDIDIRIDSIPSLGHALLSNSHHLELLSGSHIYPPDLAPILPELEQLTTQIDISTNLYGSLDKLSINHLDISTGNHTTSVSCIGEIDSLRSITGRTIDLSHLTLHTTGSEIDTIASLFTTISPKNAAIIQNLGDIELIGNAYVSALRQKFNGKLTTGSGPIAINAAMTRTYPKASPSFSGQISSQSFDLSTLLPDAKLGETAFKITADGRLGKKNPRANLHADIERLTWRGHTYSNLATTLELLDNTYMASVGFDDPDIVLLANGSVATGDNPSFDLTANISHINTSVLGLDQKYPDYILSGKLSAGFTGKSADVADGNISMTELRFVNNNGTGLNLPPIDVDIHNSSLPQHMSLSTGYLTADVEGSYSYHNIEKNAKEIIWNIFPSLLPGYAPETDHTHQLATAEATDSVRSNNFDFRISITDNPQIASFFKLPFRILYPLTIKGGMSADNKNMEVTVNAPYLQQKDKLIRNTKLRVSVNGATDEAVLSASTLMPSKYGDVSWQLGCTGASDRLDTRLAWLINNSRAFNGNIDLSASIARNPQGNLLSHLTINPGQLVFNDTIWHIGKADIYAMPERISIENIAIGREGQSLNINGVASADSTDSVIIKLANIDLDYVFGTLGIDNVMFGGIATGNFYGHSLLSSEPVLYTPKLDVRNLKYNGTIMGDTEIKSAWHNESKGISIDALISQDNGHQSEINGYIYPFTEELDFHFKADKVAVGFMQPFMAAFADKVSGQASGNAHLYGTFKYLDMTGDLYADNFNITLGFTNTTYSASDSIRLRPGSIQIDNLHIKDKFGHTALLNGWVSHKFFKEPEFDFSLTRAENFLSYDVSQSTEHPWYGRIFGNGSAFINGKPGVVNIGVDMATAPGSTFTFVLSDAEIADEYSFITFRDRNAVTITDTMSLAVGSAELDRLMHERVRKNREAESSSAYNMNFQVDVTPSAEIILVMDPVGGDRIVSRGSGHMNMQYESVNDVLKMFGTYKLNRGSYNFTLQDIIIKDFTIRDGSSIAFHGDPYSAQLNINAIYSLNANLSDLDESFLTDKDLNRTNVPVYAVLKVTGDMRLPDISFDLEFPTLTSDTYRKVRSIVSTEDMMNRQIIYLLALNRFYTPDYMASTKKNNELVSVASSTISSQLSSILGQLSDKWSVAPTVRTDRGDFSDVEVDLALSSTLLNNRLLFNGNFGYRDKTLNDNSFIGDFDIEYLLNRSGNIRLKAYNRYNDQNYYVKTALTTQGIGVVFKRDFDNIFSFLNPLLRKRNNTGTNKSATPASIASDSVIAAPDSIVIPERPMPATNN